MNLHRLGIKYHTDKAYEHGFTKVYHRYFKDIKDEISDVLEIGVYKGSSLKMWRDYFSNANLYGIDNWEQDGNIKLKEDRIHLYTCDQGIPEELEDTIKKINKPLDVILEDGSHRMDHQQSTFAILFPYIKHGGCYILEDVHTSFDWQLERFHIKKDRSNTTYKFLINLKDNKKCTSSYITEQQSRFIEDNIDSIEIYDMAGDRKHVTCIIKRV